MDDGKRKMDDGRGKHCPEPVEGMEGGRWKGEDGRGKMEGGRWKGEDGKGEDGKGEDGKGEGGGRKGDKGRWKGGQEAPMVIYFMQTVA